MENEIEQQLICPQCRYVGQIERFSRGNYKLEILLWSMLFVPGAIYTTWRFFNEFHACPICKSEAMAPLNSSLGRKIASERSRMNEPMSKKEAHRFLSKLFYGK